MIRSTVKNTVKKHTIFISTSRYLYTYRTIMYHTSLCSAQRVVHFVCQDPCRRMRHSNDIDDAMNDAIMVVDHQQKKDGRNIIYDALYY